MEAPIEYLKRRLNTVKSLSKQKHPDFRKYDKMISIYEKAIKTLEAETSEKQVLNIADVIGSLPITKTCFFELKNKKYITENGTEITTEILTKYRHSIMGNYGFIVLD